MNSIIEVLLSHRSVRDYEDKPLTDEQIETIVKCAQAGSTSSFIQAYSIIGVTDSNIKEELSKISGHEHVAKNGHLFIFCADLYRHKQIGELENKEVLDSIQSTEKFMVAVIDATIAAQNAAIAAESMGLGICYIGGLRNDLHKVCELLEIPDYVIPLFGMTVGYPKKINDLKPRLPLEHIYHHNRYQSDPEIIASQLNDYNKTIENYYHNRTNGARRETWTEQISRSLSKKVRTYIHNFVKEKGLNKQ